MGGASGGTGFDPLAGGRDSQLNEDVRLEEQPAVRPKTTFGGRTSEPPRAELASGGNKTAEYSDDLDLRGTSGEAVNTTREFGSSITAPSIGEPRPERCSEITASCSFKVIAMAILSIEKR